MSRATNRVPAGRRETDDEAYDALLAVDPVLRSLAEAHGRPDPFHWDDGGRTGDSRFAALVLHVIAQQISLTVAFAVYDRLLAALGGPVDAAGVAALGPHRLRALGMSTAKASYVMGLAEMQLLGTLDVDALADRPDDDAVSALTAARGIGPWTAQVFLLHQLRRPDVLPAGDLGIRHAVRDAYALPDTPSVPEVEQLGLSWAPRRSYAAALLWASLVPHVAGAVTARSPAVPGSGRRARHDAG